MKEKYKYAYMLISTKSILLLGALFFLFLELWNGAYRDH